MRLVTRGKSEIDFINVWILQMSMMTVVFCTTHLKGCYIGDKHIQRTTYFQRVKSSINYRNVSIKHIRLHSSIDFSHITNKQNLCYSKHPHDYLKNLTSLEGISSIRCKKNRHILNGPE